MSNDSANEILIKIKAQSELDAGLQAVTQFFEKIKSGAKVGAEDVAQLDAGLDATQRSLQALGSGSSGDLAGLISQFRAGEISIQELQGALQRVAATAATEFQSLSASATEAGGAVEVAAKGGAVALDGLTVAERETATAARDAAAATREAKPAGEEASAGLARLSDAVKNLTLYAKLYIATKLASAIGELYDKSTEAALGLERINAQLKVADGSGEAAGRELEFIRRNAELLGLPLQQSAEKFARLKVAAAETNLTGRETEDLFLGIGAAATALRLPGERAAGLFDLIERLLSRGVVTGTQLRRTLASELPGAMAIVAESFGYGGGKVDQFTDALKGQQIPAEEFVRRLGPELIRIYGTELPDAVKGSQAAYNRFGNTAFETAAELGEKLLPAVTQVLGELRRVVTENPEAVSAIGNIAVAVIRLNEPILNLMRDVRTIPAEARLAADEAKQAALGVEALATSIALSLGKVLEHLPGGERFRQLADDARAALVRIAADQRTVAASVLDDELALRKLEAGSHGAANALADLLARGKDLPGRFDFAAAAIKRGVAEIEAYADEIGRTGPVERDAADQIVKLIDKQIKAINQLPATERKAFEDRLVELSKLREHYEGFTTAYEKLHDRQVKSAEATAKREAAALKSREDRFAHFLAKITEDADRAASKEGEKSAADLRRDIEDAKAGIAGIQGKTLLDIGDNEQLDQYNQKLRESTDALRKLQSAEIAAGESADTFGAKGEQAAQKFRSGVLQAIESDDELQRTIAGMGPATKDAFIGALQGIEDAKRAGTATSAVMQDSVTKISTLLRDAGYVGAGFASRLDLVTGKGQNLRTALEGLKVSTSAATTATDGHAVALGKEAAADGQATTAANAHATALAHSSEAEKEAAAFAAAAADQAHAAGGGYIRAAADLHKYVSEAEGAARILDRAAGGGSGGLTEVGAIIKNQAKDAVAGTIEITRGAKTASDAVEGVARAEVKAADAAHELGAGAADAAAATKSGFLEIGKGGELIAATGGKVAEVGDGFVEISVGAHQGSAAVRDAGAAAEESGGVFHLQSGHLRDFGADVLDVGQKSTEAAGGTVTLGDSVQEIGQQGLAAAAGVGASKDAVEGAGKAAEQAGPPVELMAGHVKSAGDAATDAKQPLSDLAGGIKSVSDGLSGSSIPAQLDEMAKATERLRGPVTAISIAVQRIASSHAGDEVQKIGDGLQGFADGAEAAADVLTKNPDFAQKVSDLAKALGAAGQNAGILNRELRVTPSLVDAVLKRIEALNEIDLGGTSK